jgi:archaeosine-15-forming tRNA-guanine transglycosylase
MGARERLLIQRYCSTQASNLRRKDGKEGSARQLKGREGKAIIVMRRNRVRTLTLAGGEYLKQIM